MRATEVGPDSVAELCGEPDERRAGNSERMTIVEDHAKGRLRSAQLINCHLNVRIK